jgi:hypothetical protein
MPDVIIAITFVSGSKGERLTNRLATSGPRADLVDCAFCGHRFDRDLTACPQCGTPHQASDHTFTTEVRRPPLTLPAKTDGSSVLADNCKVVMQFLPSAVCFSMDLREPLTLGRIITPPGTAVMDLNHFNAYRHGVSSWHCRLERRDTRLYVTDLNSTNGTYLNGERIPAYEPQIVNDGSELILGTLRIILFFHANAIISG